MNKKQHDRATMSVGISKAAKCNKNEVMYSGGARRGRLFWGASRRIKRRKEGGCASVDGLDEETSCSIYSR